MRIFVGVAWPYANGPFHIGHLAGAYLPGDAFARYHRLAGHEVLMVSGSDMHGTPILVSAEKEGVAPEAIARRYDGINRQAFERLGFSFDLFTETHTLVHERTVQELFLKLLEKRLVERRSESLPYCPKHARFLPDRYLLRTCPHCGYEEARGDECDRCGRALEEDDRTVGRCSLCGTPAERRSSEHFFLLLNALEPAIDRFLDGASTLRPTVAKAARHVRSGGLHPTPITRDLEWGVPIPLDGYEGKRFYVWFDALIGYLSASREWAIRAGRPSAWERYWSPREQCRHYYFIGKDNIFHHTILWPGILAGVGGLPLPFDVPANEWMVLGGRKIAKTWAGPESTLVPSLLERYPPDQIRFYAALLAPQNHDTEFDPAEFERVYEEILGNQYGNFAQRLLVLARDRDANRVPAPPQGLALDGPGAIGERIRLAHARVTEEFEAVRLKEALEAALAFVREENRRFHEARPWQAEDSDRQRTLFEGLWALEATAVWLAPFLPFSSARLFRMLGRPEGPGHGDWAKVLTPPEPGRSLGDPTPLFPRAATAAGGGPESSAPRATAAEVRGGAVPLGIRCAIVLSAENHPSADRLLVLTLDIGEPTPRTVVAGLRAHYSLEALLGRRVALLSNLAPRTIRSVESRGMILAAESNGKVVLLEPPDGPGPGALLDGIAPDPPTIDYEAFVKVTLTVGRVVASASPSDSEVDVGGRTVRIPESLPTGTPVIVREEPNLPPSLLTFPDAGPVGLAEELPPGAHVR